MALRTSTVLAPLVVCLLSQRATATPTATPADTSATRAEARFREASEAFDQGRVDEACGGFAESGRLYPTLGTLLNLALCHERQGKTATAWLEFTHAAAWADDAAQGDRREFARQHAARLEHLLSRIQVELPMDGVPMVLAIDGEPIVGARRSLPVYLDPGEHILSASAPARKPYETKVTVPSPAPSTALIVHVPALESAPWEGPIAPQGHDPVVTSPSSRRTAGWAVGGVGVVLVGVAASFGIDALAKTGACGTGCDAGPAEVAEAISLASFGAGLAALAVGAWLLHGPTAKAPAGAKVSFVPLVAPRENGLAVVGTF